MSENREIAGTTNENNTIELFAYDDYVAHIKLWANLWMESIVSKLTDEGLTCD